MAGAATERCERCGADPGAGRWCQRCGKDTRPGEPVLPTPDAMAASAAEESWLAGHPEVAEAERQRQESEAAAERERERVEEQARREATRPPRFDHYRDPLVRARLARWWLWAVVAALAVSAAFAVAHLALLAGTSAQDYGLSDDVDRSEAAFSLARLIAYGVQLVCCVFFLVWLFRAYRNLTALGAEPLRFSDVWAIAGWFVPVMALFRPKQIMNDTWRASDPALAPRPRQIDWEQAVPPGILAWWWGLFLVGGWLDGFGLRKLGDWATISEARTGMWVVLAGTAALSAAAVLAIVIVGRITARQRERAERLSALPAEM